MALVSFLSGGYNLHRFSDAIGLVKFAINHFGSIPTPQCEASVLLLILLLLYNLVLLSVMHHLE